MTDSGRGSGLTTSQIISAPHGAIYVWVSGATLSYARRLARHLCRTDLLIVSPGYEAGGTTRPIVIDHAAWRTMSLENHLKWLRLETPSNPDARWTGINTAFPGTYQYSVGDWVHECFGPEIAADKQERNHRFIEEALELVQACGATASECHQLVDYVFGRDVGDPAQETGGVMVTLAALCNAHGIDLDKAARDELTRVWTKVDKIRAKQGAKPRHSPLPEAPQADAGGEAERVCHEEQLRVWANELTGGLSLGDFIREDVDYADGVELERIVMHEIKQIVISAFTHPAREALRAAAQEAGG